MQQLGSGMQVQFIGDSKVIIDCLIGKASTSTPDMRRSVLLAHTALQTLVQCFHIKAPGVEDFGQQVPRSDNSAADAAANWALDHGTFMHVYVQEVEAFLKELSQCDANSIGLLFSFDGAARGNPGPSSSGVCAWWGCFCSGAFVSKGLLIQRGTCLGIATNNISEAHGLASALKSCLRYFYWVIEQITELDQCSLK